MVSRGGAEILMRTRPQRQVPSIGSVGLAMIAVLVGTVFEPVSLVAWLAEAAAALARWTTGLVVVSALVPPIAWVSLLLSSAATLLALAFAVRGHLTAVAK